jgi:hypothetical protein
MGFENVGQTLTASETVAHYPVARPQTTPFYARFDTKMMPKISPIPKGPR